MKIEIKNKYAFFTAALVVLLLGIGIAVGVYDSSQGSHSTLWTNSIEPKSGNSISINGNVGIGTTNPGAKLHIDAGDGGLVKITGGNLQLDNARTIMFIDRAKTDGDKGRIYLDPSDDLIFLTAGTGSDINLIPSGNVGIGTTSPTQKLDVAGYIMGRDGLCIGKECRSNWIVEWGAIKGIPQTALRWPSFTEVANRPSGLDDGDDYTSCNWEGEWIIKADQSCGYGTYTNFYSTCAGGKITSMRMEQGEKQECPSD